MRFVRCNPQTVRDASMARSKEENAGYQRRWRAANREYLLRYAAANKERIAEYRRRWRVANREKLAEKARRYYAAANKEKLAEKARRWRRANKEKLAERDRRLILAVFNGRIQESEIGIDDDMIVLRMTRSITVTFEDLQALSKVFNTPAINFRFNRGFSGSDVTPAEFEIYISPR